MVRLLSGSLAGREEPLQDAELVAAALKDRSAFEPLYQRYLPRVYRYLRTRCNSDAEAADLTQVTFLKAMNSLPQYRPGRAAFSAWLLRIARNAANDAHRRRRSSIALEALPELHEESDFETPEESLLRRERLAHLRELLAALDHDKRELLSLRFAAGLKLREIAAVLGKPEATVKKQLLRLLASLKEQYREELD